MFGYFGESDSARFRFFEAVGIALRGAAEPHGLLVVLDDLHWADAGSLRLLQVIASELSGSRVLLVGTYRPPSGDEGGPLAEYLPALLRERAVSRLTLEGLDAADTESLLLQLVGREQSFHRQGMRRPSTTRRRTSRRSCSATPTEPLLTSRRPALR